MTARSKAYLKGRINAGSPLLEVDIEDLVDSYNDALSSSVNDALNAASSPGAANPFATMAYVNNTKYSVDYASLDAAISDLDDGDELIIAPGEYLIASTLTLQNKSGVILRGVGFSNQYAPATKLRWTGAAGGTLLDMSGCNYCQVVGLGFYSDNSAAGTNSTQTGLVIQGNPTYNGSFFNRFERCYFQNFGTAAKLGTASGNDQVDSVTFDKCWFYYGDAGIGIDNLSSNALVNQAIGCVFTGAGTPATATAVYVRAGGFKMLDCITALNKYGVRIVTLTGTAHIIGQHSEADAYSIYTDAAGNHQKANTLHVSDFYAYAPTAALMYLGNMDLQYIIESAYDTKVGGSDVILLPDNVEEVFLLNVTNTDGYKRASDGTTVEYPYGLYGAQGVTKRRMVMPPVGALDIKAETSGRVPIKVTNNGAASNMLELHYSGNPQFVVAPDGSVVYAGYSGDVVGMGGIGPASQAGFQMIESKFWRISSLVIGTNSDLTFNSSAKGPVLVDTTNGHTYRLQSTNGALVLTQVS